MNFKYLKYDKCPVCGSELVMQERRRWHTNGQPFEVVGFKCGHRIRWVPNFNREEVERPCPEHADEKERQAKRQVAEEKVRKYIKRLDVDDEFKELLTRYW